MTNNTAQRPSPPLPTGLSSGLIVPIFCTLITALGAAYTKYSSDKTQSYVEELKSKSDQVVAMIKADTESQITKIKAENEAQMRRVDAQSKIRIIQLTSQLEADKELRASNAADRLADQTARAMRCGEIKDVRDAMSKSIVHIRDDDAAYDSSIAMLVDGANKMSSYLSSDAVKVISAFTLDDVARTRYEKLRAYYGNILEGYNAELRISCAR